MDKSKNNYKISLIYTYYGNIIYTSNIIWRYEL